MEKSAAILMQPESVTLKQERRRVLGLLAHLVYESRETIRGLRPSSRSSHELERAFLRSYEELAVQQEVNQIAFRFIVGGTPRPLHPTIEDEIHLIGREALINAFRHSRASEIEVELEYTTKSLRVLVRDDGCGIDTHVLRSGRDKYWGLSGMRERAQRMGARLRVLSRVGAGTEVELSVACKIAFAVAPEDCAAGWFPGLYRGENRDEKAQWGREQAR
jgi:signal transduction histidine kinase